MNKIRTVLWQQWDNIGLEYLVLIQNDDNIEVDSTIIGYEYKTPFRLHYQIQCDAHYQLQKVILDLAGRSPLTLITNDKVQWFDKDNQPLHALDGCVDIDISATPFTNTLPIRRLEWQPGQSRLLDMVYIKIPELTIERVTQQYTCLEKDEQTSIFEYRQPDFSAILPIDADGFVQNYPKLFRRLA